MAPQFQAPPASVMKCAAGVVPGPARSVKRAARSATSAACRAAGVPPPCAAGLEAACRGRGLRSRHARSASSQASGGRSSRLVGRALRHPLAAGVELRRAGRRRRAAAHLLGQAQGAQQLHVREAVEVVRVARVDGFWCARAARRRRRRERPPARRRSGRGILDRVGVGAVAKPLLQQVGRAG